MRSAALFFLLIPATVLAAPLDSAHSQVGFTLTQMNSPMQGRFAQVHGDVTFNPARPAQGKADISIQTASIELPTPQASAMARGSDWFDTARFPVARFVASGFKALGGNRFQVNGKLTIKGVTHDVAAPFTVQSAGASTRTDGVLTISRLAYKIGDGDWSDTSTVADPVQIRFSVTFPTSH